MADQQTISGSICLFYVRGGGWNLLRCDVMDICLAKNGLRPSKNTFDRITLGSAGTFIRVLYCNLNRLIEACEILS